MSTDVLVKKLNREVGVLREEVNKMQKLLFQVVADTEGEYRPSYVKKMLLREKAKPVFRYLNKKTFLDHVRGK